MKNGHDELGRKVYLFAASMHGERDASEWGKLLLNICALMNMTPVHEAMTYSYPVDDAGGVGFTIIQPITESFLALDSWPDHEGGAYLFICSCRAFDKQKIVDFLIQEQHFVIVEAVESGLRL